MTTGPQPPQGHYRRDGSNRLRNVLATKTSAYGLLDMWDPENEDVSEYCVGAMS